MPPPRIIHFLDYQHNQFYGEPEIENADDLLKNLQNRILFATVLEGTGPFELVSQPDSQRGDRKRVKVAEILPLLAPKDVPLVRCIGLNYIKHSKSES
jgi:hypothetical protein